MVLGILETLSAAVTLSWDFIKEYSKKVYDIIKDTFDYLIKYVDFLASTFPYDQPKKTLMLSLIFFILVIGVVLSFNSSEWKHSGVGSMEPYKVSVNTDPGNEQTPGNGGNDTTPVTIPVTPTSECYSDADCQGSGEDQSERLCCYSDLFEGYSCAGHCLASVGDDRAACKHPNACLYLDRGTQQAFMNHAQTTSGRCDVTFNGEPRDNQDTYCMQSQTDIVGGGRSVCCQNIAADCYGYCLKDTSSNCFDYKACNEELIIQPVLLEVGDI